MLSPVKLGRVVSEQALKNEVLICPLRGEQCVGSKCMKWIIIDHMCEDGICPYDKECSGVDGEECKLKAYFQGLEFFEKVGFCSL